MFHRGKQLNVCAQTAPEGCPRGGAQTEGEFTLEHEDGGTDDGAVREEFEDEWRGDLREGGRASAGGGKPVATGLVRT